MIKKISVRLIVFLIGCLLVSAACYVSKEFGYQQGVAETKELHFAADIARLNLVLDDFNVAVRAAGEANLQLNKTISARQKADAESTKVFTNALNATAHLRFNCVFDDSIMQQLHQTADRADQAAASGISVAMPSSSPPDG